MRESGSEQFREGQSVEVVQGPFMGFTGPVVGFKETKRRVTILITIYGLRVPVELVFHDVREL